MWPDIFILIAFWLLTIIMLLIYLPKGRYREAIVIFLFKQLMTWLLGIIIVEAGLIEYPVRFFSYAIKSSFTFEYFVYPAICIVFVMYYPTGKSFARQLLHFIYYCSVLTIIEVLLERYTNLIKYTHWTWYVTWLTLAATFLISRKFYLWFFNKDKIRLIGDQ